MKKYFKKGLALSLSKGFTMIELLIVIAVLGVLAVAVLSAINPIEQINRGKDTGSRSDAEQLVSAVDRFYAIKGYYPWQIGQSDTAKIPTAWAAVDATWADTDDVSVLTKLSSGGTAEIKESFTSRISASGYNALWKFLLLDSSDSFYLCFVPKSGSFREEAWKRCTANVDFGALPLDYPPGACPADGTCTTAVTSENADGCHICLP